MKFYFTADRNWQYFMCLCQTCLVAKRIKGEIDVKDFEETKPYQVGVQCSNCRTNKVVIK